MTLTRASRARDSACGSCILAVCWREVDPRVSCVSTQDLNHHRQKSRTEESVAAGGGLGVGVSDLLARSPAELVRAHKTAIGETHSQEEVGVLSEGSVEGPCL